MSEQLEQRIYEIETKQEEYFKRLWELEMQAVRSEQVSKGIEDALKEIKSIVRDIQSKESSRISSDREVDDLKAKMEKLEEANIKQGDDKNKELKRWVAWFVTTAVGILVAVQLKGA